jgi:hypothetical protein
MTAYTADQVTIGGTNTANLRTGTASADTVPAGALLLVNNTGAGTHLLDLGFNFQPRGFQVSNSTAAGLGKVRFTLAAGSWTPIRVAPEAGDANGQCSVTIDGTASEVKYFVLAA